MIALGLLKLPIPGPPSHTSFPSSLYSTPVSAFSILSVDNGVGAPSESLPKSNIDFLNNLPPIREFSQVKPSEKDWAQLVAKQGLKIRQALIKDYPLAFFRLFG